MRLPTCRHSTRPAWATRYGDPPLLSAAFSASCATFSILARPAFLPSLCAGAAASMRVFLANLLPWAEFRRTYGQPIATRELVKRRLARLAGLIPCGRCGRRLAVAYTGRCSRRPVYRCDRPNLMLGRPRCLGFGGSRIEAAIAREVLLVVEPMAVEAALEAERRRMESRDERQRIADLELQQARYEASLAERRYAACDPDNRLIAAQLEKSWEASLQQVKACEARLEGLAPTTSVQAPDLSGLADDLEAAWNAPGVTMRGCGRLPS